MAKSDFMAFLPSESAYTNPGEYETAQRNVALEKATYMSSMDQFYAGLEEQAREFDLNLGFQREALQEQAREADQSAQVSREGIAAQTAYWKGTLDLEKYRLNQEASQFEISSKLQEKAISNQWDLGILGLKLDASQLEAQIYSNESIARMQNQTSWNIFQGTNQTNLLNIATQAEIAANELALKGDIAQLEHSEFMHNLALQTQQFALDTSKFDFTKDMTSASFLESIRQFQENLAVDWAKVGQGQEIIDNQEEKDWWTLMGEGIGLLDDLFGTKK